jgi:hypothetical protein
MKLGLGCCLLASLGLVSCAPTGGASVNGDNPTDIKSSPAGVSTLAFMDVELVRPDAIAGASGLPTGVTSGEDVPGIVPASRSQFTPQAVIPTALTFTNVKAADGGYINGTILQSMTGPGAYTETFDLTVTPTQAPVSGTPAWTWVYTGQQFVAVTGTSAVVTANTASPNALTATYTNNGVSPAKVQAYLVSTPTPLQVGWNASTSPTAVTLYGEYQVTLPGVETITGTILQATQLEWDPATCVYPLSGTLTLGLTQVSPALTDSTNVVFSSACGQTTIGGASFNLGQ